MTKFFFLLIFLVAIGIAAFTIPKQVFAADICWNTRNVSEHLCVLDGSTNGACIFYISPCVGGDGSGGDFDPGIAHDMCALTCGGTYAGHCDTPYCVLYSHPSYCQAQDFIVGCTSPPDCSAIFEVGSCEGSATGDSCIDDRSEKTYGCWGPGVAPTPTPGPSSYCGDGTCNSPGENCSNCSTDCEACPPSCPNGKCDINETCLTCEADCEVCPPPPTPSPGTIQARAMQVDPALTCTDIRALAAGGITGASFSFNAASPSHPTPAPPTQSGSSYVAFHSATNGLYTIIPQAPAGYVPAKFCWQTTVVPKSSGETNSATLPSADTLTWDVVYTQGTAWSQAAGGDVYASANLSSFVPVGASPRAFILNGTTGGYPGVATYGTDTAYNFDSSGATKGQAWVSSKNWLAYDPSPAPDFYQLMYSQFGGAPATVDYPNPGSPITMPASRPAPYYVTGAMTTSGNWSVAAGQTIVFLVNGNLAIAGNITVAPGGFAAFIVNGTITVDPAVAAVQGVYITSSAGTFNTGTGAVRFVGTGTFVAGNFILGRNLGDAGNLTMSSELFIYNPQLLMTMPEQMKKLSVSWQEVAP